MDDGGCTTGGHGTVSGVGVRAGVVGGGIVDLSTGVTIGGMVGSTVLVPPATPILPWC